MRGETDSRPPRPSLPPLLVAGLVLWATTALLWPPLRLVPAQILPVAGTTALGLATLLAPRILRGVRAGGVPLGVLAALAVLASVALCAFWGGALRGSMALADAEGRSSDSAAWRVELTEDARRGDFGWHAEARLSCEDGRTLRARLNLPEDAALLQGQSLTVAGALRPPSETAAEYYWGAGLAASLTVSGSDFPSEERSLDSTPFVSLRQRALDLIDAHGGGNAPLLQALVCGWRPAIEESGLYDCFKAVGLAHLVAVSGAHLSIVSLFVAGGLRLLRCGRPGQRADERPVPHWLCRLHRDAPVSALRAAIMAATGLFSLWTDRRNSALSALGLCLLLFVGIDPSAALSVSLALSAGSTLGIVLFAPLLSSAFAGHAFEEGRGRPHRSHRRLSLGDPALCGGALLPAAAAVAAGQSGRKSSVRPGMPCRIRRRARRLPRSRRRAVAHRRCQHSLRAAVPRRGCPRVAFGHVPSHRRRPFGGRSTLLRALPRTVGLVAASEHQEPDGGGNRRRPNPRSASFSLRHGPRRHRHARCGPRRCLYRAQRRKRAAHRHGQPGCPVEGRLGPASGWGASTPWPSPTATTTTAARSRCSGMWRRLRRSWCPRAFPLAVAGLAPN